ncbi:MAG: hypothetical protein H7305_11800 [Gemmatimonadaceae bacterium]|nr:hypothetical protein [Gemmatimonadaceae bacterium]
MMRLAGFRPSTVLAATAAAFLSGCASDSALAPGTTPMVSLMVVSNTNVVRPSLTSPGAFVAATPSNVGRGAGGAFWDNESADQTPADMRCNSGFYATGNFSSVCQNQTGSSYDNRGGYTTYFGDGASNRDATAFSFAAGFEYTVTLKGTYAGNESEVGYYTVTPAGANFYTEVPAWSGKAVGTPVVINTGGRPWGFYIRNTVLSPTGGCGGTSYYCSEAEGGYSSVPYQQFALFGNAAGNGWLAGVEDNFLNVLPNGSYQDSDYNDYMFSITARELVEPSVCDFMTFGRTQIAAVNGDDVVISGNAGGNSPQGGILGNFLVKVGNAQYNLQNISAYGPITSGVFSGIFYPNARRIVGTTKEGVKVEIRIYDGGEPGRVDDAVYVLIGASTPLGANGTDLDRGNIQYHANCRGPRS